MKTLKTFENFGKSIKLKPEERAEKIDAILQHINNQDDDNIIASDIFDQSTDEKINNVYNNIFSVNEGGETTAVAGSGQAVGGLSFGGVQVAGVSIDGGHSTQGSSGVSTLGSTQGMGAIVSPQPSDTPGDVRGSTKGSGDISKTTLKPFTKSFPKTRKKRKTKKKKTNAEKGAQIDKFYTSKYTEKYEKNGKIIQNWKTFNEEKNGNEKV